MIRRVYKLTESGHCARNTNMVQQSIISVLEDCTKMSHDSGKFDNGNIYFYDSNKSGIKDENDTYYEYYNTGWMCVDFDIELSTIEKYNKEHNTNYNHNDLVQLIWDKFQEYSSYFPCINYIQYSSSHYLKPDMKDGVHILVRCRKGLVHKSFYGKSFNGCDKVFNQFDLFEYQHECLRFVINRLISKYCDIPLDLLELVNDDAMDRFGQKMTLFYSPYKSNQFSIDTIVFDVENYKDYQVKFKKTNLYKLNKDSIIVKDVIHLDTNNIKYEGDKIQVDHYNRWVKIKSLLTYGFGIDETLNICNQYYTNNVESGDKPYSLQDWYNYYNLHVKNNNSTLTKSAFNKTIRELRGKGLGLEVVYRPDNDYVLQPKKDRDSQNNIIYIDTYLSEHPGIVDLVMNELNYGRVYIKANTGAGKTNLVSLFDKYNPIVVTPYNITNKLYKNFVEVSSSTNNPYVSDKPIVCIYDQFMKPEFLREVKRDNRLVIIDECHTMSDERSFRNKIICFDEFIKTYNRVIAISATPTSELTRHSFKLIEFYKQSRIKNIFITKTDSVLNSMVEKIDYLLTENYKVAVFSDLYSRRLYEHYIQRFDLVGEVADIRAERKNSDDYKLLMNDEILKHKLTFFTRIFFNGGNIQNKDEKIAVVMDVNENITSTQIIQISGRLRNNNGDVFVFVDTNKDSKEEKRLEERDGLTKTDIRKNKTLLTNEILKETNSEEERTFVFDGSGLHYDERELTENFIRIQKEIEIWNQEHSKIDVIIDELSNIPHFNIWVGGENNNDQPKGLQSIKRNTSNKLRKELNDEENYVDGVFVEFIELEGDRDNYSYVGENKYLYEWLKKIKKICDKGISLDMVVEFINNSDERNLMDTILSKLYKTVCISLLNDEVYDSFMKNIEKVKEKYSGYEGGNKIIYSDIEKKIKDYKKTREISKKIFEPLDLSDINFDDYSGLCEFEKRLCENELLRKWFFKDFDLKDDLFCCKLMEDGSFFDLCLVDGIVSEEIELQRKKYLDGKQKRNESHSKKVKIVYKNGVVKEFDSDGDFRKWWSVKFGGGDGYNRTDFKKLRNWEIVNGWRLVFGG